MNQTLRNFYTNVSEREAVKAFIIDVLKEVAVERAFEGKDIGGIKDAHGLVEKAFGKLEEIYGKIEPEVIINSR